MDNLETGQSRHLLPTLPYDHAAFEPHIDARTMTLHHDKHHASYVDWREVARRFEHSELSPERRWEDDGGLVLGATT